MIVYSYQKLPSYLNYAKNWQAPTREAGRITSQASFFVNAVSHCRIRHKIHDINSKTFHKLF